MTSLPHDVVEPDPTFVRKLCADCWLNLAGLLGASCLFLLWCVPSVATALLSFPRVALAVAVVSVGPALVGLFHYAAGLVLDRPGGIWRDSLWGWRSGFRAGVVAMAVAIGSVTAFPLAAAAWPPAVALAARVVYMALLILLLLAGSHALALIGLYEQDIRHAIRNALLLTVAHPAPALGLLGADVLALVLVRMLGGGPLIIVPALLALLHVSTTRLLVHQHQPLSEGSHGGDHSNTHEAG